MNPLQYTSLLFSLIIYKSFSVKNYIMGNLWIYMLLISLLYHSDRNNKTTLIWHFDQVGIILIVLYGAICTKYATRSTKIRSVFLFLTICSLYLIEVHLDFTEDDRIHILLHITVVILFLILLNDSFLYQQVNGHR